MPAESEDVIIGKYFRLERGLVKRMRIYAAEHDMKETQVIEEALQLLFAQAEQPDAEGNKTS